MIRPISRQGGSFFTAETHIRHIDETHLGSVIEVRTRVLMGEGKKMHVWHEMYAGEKLLATGEHILIHVSLETRRPAPFSAEIAANLKMICEAQAGFAMLRRGSGATSGSHGERAGSDHRGRVRGWARHGRRCLREDGWQVWIADVDGAWRWRACT